MTQNQGNPPVSGMQPPGDQAQIGGKPNKNGDGPLHQLFMSSNRECMNLFLLRSKACELRNSLNNIIQTLHVCPDRIAWGTALEQFGALNIQYYHLLDQLRPMLKHWVVHPKVVDASNHEILPLMMSTRVLPDMEKEESELLNNHEAAHRNTPAKNQYVSLLAEIEEFNSLIDNLTTMRRDGNGSGILNAKNDLIAQIKAPISKSSAAALETLQKQTAAGGRPGRKLLGGKSSGAEMLLLAATRGDGLR
mmetsp:Transcript_16928/g.30229  ORF Transcript_16928/g.30229 Transcript_16928/m.30229 type:complete len:249 (-) Transcript_16928:594-1340(-)|eukprot:CAMPEP_0177751342 /NCGR_PEP_ID=MMETSP0491_2-20121128/322_1 /TAXON_ID=63592 /ORGANISM="Tetraselmis chuii, Strain PLY429" /LENGTH=248 /DNA_ID=CAMNT_0019266447 /DNA_START=168 /DNA_END=914 /DNA_ORIENTATION=+